MARNIAWIERYCRFVEGDQIGQPIRLTPKQKTWIRDIYGSPTRTYILSVGKKNSKTTLSAMLTLLHLCGPEAKPNTELYSTAQSREQAALLFTIARKMIELNPELLAVVRIKESWKILTCPELGTSYRSMSKESSTAHGIKAQLAIHDELGQCRGPRSDLYDAVETSMGATVDPLSIIISTQARDDAAVLSTLIDDALTGADPLVKVRLYTAPLEDDPFCLATIRKANPHINAFMNKAELLRMAAEAQRLPSKQASYRNLILNQRVDAESAFIPVTDWKRAAGEPLEDLRGRKVWGGLDLSVSRDLTACVWISPEDESRELWRTACQFWIPGEGLADRARSDRIPWDLWRDQGHIEACPGPTVDYEHVALYIARVFKVAEVERLAFDRAYMRFLRPWLERAGLSRRELDRIVPFGQGYISMTPAIRELESWLVSGKLQHGGHPVLNMCASNVRVVSDDAGSRKFTKARSAGKIDGMVCLGMAVGSAAEQAEERPKYRIL